MKLCNEIIIYNDYCELIIKNENGKEVANSVFSKKHYNNIKNFKWFVLPKYNRWGKTYYYIATKVYKNRKQKTFYLHHLILGRPENNRIVVDHINRNSFDNRDENLRFATRRENILNSDYLMFGQFKPSPIYN